MLYLRYLQSRICQVVGTYEDAFLFMRKGGQHFLPGLVMLLVSIIATPLIPFIAMLHYAHKTGE